MGPFDWLRGRLGRPPPIMPTAPNGQRLAGPEVQGPYIDGPHASGAVAGFGQMGNPRRRTDWAMIGQHIADMARGLQGQQGQFAQGLQDRRMMEFDRQRDMRREDRDDAWLGTERERLLADRAKADAADQQARAQAVALAGNDPELQKLVTGAVTGAAALELVAGRSGKRYETDLQVDAAGRLGNLEVDQYGRTKAIDVAAANQIGDAEQERQKAWQLFIEGRPMTQVQLRLAEEQLKNLGADRQRIFAEIRRMNSMGNGGGGGGGGGQAPPVVDGLGPGWVLR